MTEEIKAKIKESLSVKESLLADEKALAATEAAVREIVNCLRTGHKVMWAGNGGSAADAQHMAAELVNKFRLDRAGLPAMALTVDTSILTAIGNDYGYDRVFARQVEACGKAGDVFIGLSTSGNSVNLVKALEACKAKGLVSVALVGEKACAMDAYDYVIHIPSEHTPRIQECQTLIGHILCDAVEQSLFGAESCL